MFKFIHAADIHLDSPLRGLSRYEGAPLERIRGATRQALENLAALAVDEQVAFVLIAGDLYDGDWKDYNTGLFFNAQMSRLREAGIRVYVVKGNHDAASQITRHLHSPDNVTFLSIKECQTELLEEQEVAIHGRSYATRAVTEEISSSYPQALPDVFNIGLLHTSVDGRKEHEPYAPCTVKGLLAKGYHYWALGHVHRREILHEDPWIVFPGNIQGRHARETGPKGCTLVTVEDGQVLSVEHQDLDVLQWAQCEVDVSDVESGEEMIDHVRSKIIQIRSSCEGQTLAVRIHVTGACAGHEDIATKPDRWLNEIRTVATDLGDVWVEKVLFETRTPGNLEEMQQRDDAIGGLLRAIQALDASQDELGLVAGELSELQRKLPTELQVGPDALKIDDPEFVRAMLEDVKHLLIARLLSKGHKS